MNPRAFRPPPRRRFALNPQMREDLGRFLRDGQIRIHGFRLALLVGLAFLVTWPGDPVLDMVKGIMRKKGLGGVPKSEVSEEHKGEAQCVGQMECDIKEAITELVK